MAEPSTPRRPARPRHRRPRVTLDQLHTFLAVAENEHVTAAAEALGQSQGSVSASIRRLEEALHLPLLHRVGRRVRLTDVGRAVRQLSIRTLEDAAQIEELSAGYLAFDRGEVAVAAGRVMGAHRLAGWLAPFIHAHADIDVLIHLAPARALITMLQEGSADIVILGSDVRLPGVETLVLERTELVIVVAAQHALARSTAPARELGEHRYLAHESGTATQQRAARVLGHLAEDAATVELEEGALLAALLAGIGYAVMPRSVVETEIAAGHLVVLGQRRSRIVQPFTAARRAALHTPAVQAFWEHLQRVASVPPKARG